MITIYRNLFPYIGHIDWEGTAKKIAIVTLVLSSYSGSRFARVHAQIKRVIITNKQINKKHCYWRKESINRLSLHLYLSSQDDRRESEMLFVK